MIVAALSLIVLSCVAFLVPVPYVTLRPGPAFDTLGEFNGDPIFTFGKNVRTYPTSGSLDFTTVSVTRADSDVSLGEAFRSYFENDVAVVPKSLIYPDNQSAEDSTEESAAQLNGSKDSSRVAALRAAGFTVTGVPSIAEVVKGGASEGSLRAGDVVRTVDGKRVRSVEETIEAVADRKPGQSVRLGITRKTKASEVSIVTRPDPQDPQRPRVGVSLSTKYRYPFEVDNNVSREVGGPSAGSMFALAIYDKLTPGSLTGGEVVAGTGEIDYDGNVGQIGGVAQKLVSSQEDGATFFLSPAGNCTEALRAPVDFAQITVLRIETLEGAISSLEALAEDPDASVPTC